MELYDTIDPRTFLSSRGEISPKRISKSLQDLLGYPDEREYFFVIENIKIGKGDSTRAYIINGEIFRQIIESDIYSLLEEYKESLSNWPAKSHFPVNIKGNKFGDYKQPDHVILSIETKDYSKVSRDIMRIYYFEDSESPTVEEILEKQKNKRHAKPALISKKKWKKDEDFYREEGILGPYRMDSKRKIKKIIDDKKFRKSLEYNQNCFALDRKHDLASVLSFKKVYDGLEEKLDDNDIECYNFYFVR